MSALFGWHLYFWYIHIKHLVCSEASWCPHFLSCFQVWGAVSSEDIQAAWGVEWGTVARWAVAITVHFKISNALLSCNIAEDVERESCE